MFHIACNAIKQMRGLQKTMIIEDVEDNALNSSDNERVDGGAQNKKGEKRKKVEPMNYLPKSFTWPN